MTGSKDTSAPSDLITIRSEVTDYLLAYCHREQQRATSLHPNYGRLWGAIGTYLEAGGKRLRPYLMVASYEAFGGINHAAIIKVAAAWECIHAAMLIHDDIIDRDYTRHGQPNVAGIYLQYYAQIKKENDRVHFADSSAMMAGDLLLSAAYKLLQESSFPSTQINTIRELLYEAIFSTAGGELLDTETGTLDIDISPRLIAEVKTANYSLIGPLLSGGILAGIDQTTEQQLRKLGLVLGVGFQYVDDVLGIFGDQAATGKPAMRDLEENKRTLVIVDALNHMTPERRNRAEYLLRNSFETSVQELHKLINTNNFQIVIAKRIEQYRTQSQTLVEQLGLAPQHQAIFEQIITMLLDRKS